MSSATVQASPSSSETTYDRTPYPSASFPQSSPNRLAAVGRLFGLKTTLPSKARVLELGCANGANLLPLAEQFPGATFLGIDASQVQIAAGKKAQEAAGLKNVELRQQDILTFDGGAEKYDYIIAHGVYSWVPAPVREKIMQICERHLTEQGIAYISYNALPGWNMRRSLRDMMLLHTGGFQEPAQKIQQARALIQFLAESVSTEKTAYALHLQAELQAMATQPDSYILHDLLEEENTAFYFHEFVAHAMRHRLQYLSEPHLSQMLAANFPEKVSETLKKIGNNIVTQEQYMDFLRNRTFRQTLLCRSGVPLRRNLSVENLKPLAVQSLLASPPKAVDLKQGVKVSFSSPAGPQVTVADSFLKAAFAVLTESGARALAFGELLEAARAKAKPFIANPVSNEIEEATLATNLMTLYTKGFIDVCAEPVAVRLDVPEKPKVSALARHQALNARFITNRVHAPIPADPLGRVVVVACDGTKNRDEIMSTVIQEVKAGRLNMKEGDKPVTDEIRMRELLGPQIATILSVLARSGFFSP